MTHDSMDRTSDDSSTAAVQ